MDVGRHAPVDLHRQAEGLLGPDGIGHNQAGLPPRGARERLLVGAAHRQAGDGDGTGAGHELDGVDGGERIRHPPGPQVQRLRPALRVLALTEAGRVPWPAQAWVEPVVVVGHGHERQLSPPGVDGLDLESLPNRSFGGRAVLHAEAVARDHLTHRPLAADAGELAVGEDQPAGRAADRHGDLGPGGVEQDQALVGRRRLAPEQERKAAQVDRAQLGGGGVAEGVQSSIAPGRQVDRLVVGPDGLGCRRHGDDRCAPPPVRPAACPPLTASAHY